MSFSRRKFLKSLSRSAIVLTFDQVLASAIPPRLFGQNKPADVTTSLGVEFINVAREAGLNAKNVFGGEHKNKYLLETTGCGVAFYDYDNDGWLDIFLVNGTRLEGFPKGQEPINHLFKNNRDGTFTDVTVKAGLGDVSGWGQAACIGDYDNDGWDDLFVTYFGPNQLYRNNGNGTFTNVTEKAGLLQKGKFRWNTGAAFLDYDRDGHLDLFVGNYIDLDLATAPVPESGPCLYKSIMVACGPPGMTGGKNILYHNNGDGTFTDVSEKTGVLETPSTYALGVLAIDLDNDGWPDIYVANDSMPATLYQNKHNGKFEDVAIEAGCALSADGKPQAGMGVSAADYNSDGNIDIVKTNFAGDTPSLFKGMGGGMNFEDVTFAAGLGVNTRFLGWGVGFFDFDNDSWPDILICNGHVYPEVEQLKTEAGYAQRKVLFKNLRDGKFEDITAQAGPGMTELAPARGAAFGDYDNDGDVDVVVNCVNVEPQLLRCDSKLKNNWIKVKCVGVKSNRTAINTRLHCVSKGPDGKPHQQVDEVRSGGGYFAQNDLRIHFGLGEATLVDLLEVRWPTGETQSFKNLAANKLYVIKEGDATPQAQELKPAK